MSEEKRIKLTPQQIRQRRAERMAERENNDIRAVLQTPEGRRLYRKTMADAGLWQEAFVKGFPDQTDYNLGRLSIGRDMLFNLMKADPTAFEKMNREHASEMQRIEAEDIALAKEQEQDILNPAA